MAPNFAEARGRPSLSPHPWSASAAVALLGDVGHLVHHAVRTTDDTCDVPSPVVNGVLAKQGEIRCKWPIPVLLIELAELVQFDTFRRQGEGVLGHPCEPCVGFLVGYLGAWAVIQGLAAAGLAARARPSMVCCRRAVRVSTTATAHAAAQKASAPAQISRSEPRFFFTHALPAVLRLFHRFYYET